MGEFRGEVLSFGDVAVFSNSCSRAFSRLAMRRPSALDCNHPPYVRGGSYGVGEVRCQLLSAASRRAPCLRMVVSVWLVRVARVLYSVLPDYNDNGGRLGHDWAERWMLRCEIDTLLHCQGGCGARQKTGRCWRWGRMTILSSVQAGYNV